MYMKKYFYILPLLALTFSACRSYFDDNQLDNANPPVTDIRTGMTYEFVDDDYVAVSKHATNIEKALALCTPDDSSAYTNLLAIGKNKCFTEDASADMYAAAVLQDKFPYLDNGTMCDVTYTLLEGKSNRVKEFEAASSFALTTADYETIWNGHGALYLTPESEKRLPDYLAAKFTMAKVGKIMVIKYNYLETEPGEIIPFLDYECTVAEILATKETVEHQIHGTVGFFKPAVAKNTGQFYLKDGQDSILVYSMKHEDGSKVWESEGLAYGDPIVIKAKYTEVNGVPQLQNAIFVSKGEPAPAMRRVAAAKVDTLLKNEIYQLSDLGWQRYANDQLFVCCTLPEDVYTALGTTVIADPEKTVGTWLRKTYPYAEADQIYLICYNTASGVTGNEWIFDGTDFVLSTGFVDESMSFEVKDHKWIPNISTFLAAKFVGEGLGKFTIQHINLDGLSYVWRYQAAYGATASAYVSSVNHRVEDWLISPTIRLKKSVHPQMSFDHAVRYGAVENNPKWLNVMVTNNFTGDVTTTEWKHLEFPDSIPDGSNWTFLSTGYFDLSEYNNQKIVIAFRYNTNIDGIEVASAPTWEIQNLLVAEKPEENAE